MVACDYSKKQTLCIKLVEYKVVITIDIMTYLPRLLYLDLAMKIVSLRIASCSKIESNVNET